jgi:hypothetical protein
MIDQALLLYKLGNYCLRNNALSLLAYYFCDRYQMTVIHGVESQFVNIKLAVPQGSVLGPLLFIIFINDLAFFLINILSILFADDTTLLFHGGTIDSVISSCKLDLAATKFKLLGFIIDQKLDFQSHVAHLCLTISR